MHDVAADLRRQLDAWWDEVSLGFADMCCISPGNDAENPTLLTAMDVMGDVTWHQAAIVTAQRLGPIG